MTITVTGETLLDIRYKLGIRPFEVAMRVSWENNKPSFYVSAFGASDTFLSQQAALHFLRVQVLSELAKRKKKGQINRALTRPSTSEVHYALPDCLPRKRRSKATRRRRNRARNPRRS